MDREQQKAATAQAVAFATAATKPAKEEILNAATGNAVPPEKLQRFDMMDQFIRHYLTLKFNPTAYTWMKASTEDALFVIKSEAESVKEGATISFGKLRNILDRHAQRPGA